MSKRRGFSVRWAFVLASALTILSTAFLTVVVSVDRLTEAEQIAAQATPMLAFGRSATLHGRLLAERNASEVLVRSLRAGRERSGGAVVPPQFGAMVSSRAELDAVADLLSPEVRRRVGSIRTAIDNGGIDPVVLVTEYSALLSTTQRQFDDAGRQLDDALVMSSSGSNIIGPVLDLVASAESLVASLRQSTGSIGLFLNSVPSQPFELAVATERYERSLADVEQWSASTSQAVFDQLRLDPEVAYLDAQLRSATTEPSNAEPMGERMFDAALIREGFHFRLLSSSRSSGDARVAEDRRAALAALRAALLVGGLAIAVSTLMSTLGARYTSMAFRRVGESLDAVAAGGEPPEPVQSGLREVRHLTSSIGRLAAQLADVEVAHSRMSRLVSQQQELEAQLSIHSSIDLVTGTLNRSSVIEALSGLLLRPSSYRHLALLAIDLDDFTSLNEVHGPQRCDQVLRSVVERIRLVVRPGDLVARWGGGQFLVVTDPVISLSAAQGLAERIAESIGRSHQLHGAVVAVSASVGVALASDSDAVALIRRALLAVATDRFDGSGGSAEFELVESGRRIDRLDIVHELRASLAAGALGVVYQPVVDRSGALLGFEAYVRWQRDDADDDIDTTELIAVAETSGLVVDIDRWICRETLDQLAQWSLIPAFEDVQLTVNVSQLSLKSGSLVGDIIASLDRGRIEPRRLIVDVHNVDEAAHDDVVQSQLTALRSHGVLVAYDGFDPNRLSLQDLALLPVDVLKIDQANVTSGLVADYRALALRVVATRIETEAQQHVAHGARCFGFQGYNISRPLPSELLVVKLSAAGRTGLSLVGGT